MHNIYMPRFLLDCYFTGENLIEETVDKFSVVIDNRIGYKKSPEQFEKLVKKYTGSGILNKINRKTKYIKIGE